MFNKFVLKLIEKKAEFSIKRDNYGNLYVKPSVGNFAFMDMGEHISVSAPNLYAKCKTLNEVMFLYESARD